MRLNLHYILNSIKSAWKKRRGDPSFRQETLFNSFCKIISDGKIEKVEKSKISKWLNGGIQSFDEDLQKYANAARYNRKVLAREIEETIIPNIQTDKISTLVSDWKEIIDQDNTIPANEKRTFDVLADSSVSQFLAEIILYSFIHNCCSEVSANKRSEIKHSGRKQGDEEEQASQTNNLLSSLRKKCCEKLSQQKRLLKYEIIPQLVSKPDIDLSEHDYNLLVAEGGAGKTSFLLDHWARLLESNETETKELPVYVPLNRFEGNDEFFIRNYIKKHYFSSQNDLGFDDWINNAKGCDIILLLDAINEAKNSRELGSEIEILCSLGCKIILTSRHEMEGWVSLENFKRVHLLPLSETIVDEQLKEHKLEVLERLRPLLTKPMYLALLLKIGEGAKEVESPGELLLAHHKRVQQTFGVDKHGVVYNEIGEKAFETVLPQMATVTDTLKFNGKDVKAVIEEHFADEGWDYREVLNLFVDAGVLTKERQTYFFSHGHYLDFYRAYGIYQPMTKGQIPTALESGLLSNSVAAFLADLSGEYRFVETGKPSFIEQWMQTQLADRRDDQARFVCRNLVEVMEVGRQKNLEGCCFDYLDLSLCNFYETRVSYASFKDAFVKKDAFISVNHSDFITGMASTPDGKRIITGSTDGRIKVWDAERLCLDHDIVCENNTFFSVAPMGDFLVAGGIASQVLDIYKLSPDKPMKKCAHLAGAFFPSSVTISPDGKKIISGHKNGSVCLWTYEGNWSGDYLIEGGAGSFRKETIVIALGNDYVAVNTNGKLTVLGITKSQEDFGEDEIVVEAEGAASAMAADPESGRLFYIDAENDLKEYNCHDGRKRIVSRNIPAKPEWMAFSAQSHLLAVASDYKIVVWNVAVSKQKVLDLWEMDLRHRTISGVFLGSDQMAIVDTDNAISILKISAAKLQHQISGYKAFLEGRQNYLMSPDGRFVLRYGQAGLMVVYDRATESLSRIEANGSFCFCGPIIYRADKPLWLENPFSPNSKKLAFGEEIIVKKNMGKDAEYFRKYKLCVLDLDSLCAAYPDLHGEAVDDYSWISDEELVCITRERSVIRLRCSAERDELDCRNVSTFTLKHYGTFRKTQILPCGSGVVLLSTTNELSVLDLHEQKIIPIKQYELSDSINIHISPKGECAVVNAMGVDILTKQGQWRIERSSGLPEGEIYFWGDMVLLLRGKNSTISIWNKATGQCVGTVEMLSKLIITRNEKFIVNYDRFNRGLVVIDTLTGETVHTVDEYGDYQNWELSLSGKKLTAIDYTGVIIMADLSTDEVNFWDPVDAKDVWCASFMGSEGLDQSTKLTLAKHGASVE